ncbi:putative Cytochrome bd2, subunit I [Rubellimicrobium mesophilum DSM 19309]|uniref:Putative Cytochrome bd2, subunit I n=1 Tax=Rubellimicrobium mesophilum DSM 19309 TaxID=442562 RepID=A0A017HF48_9RHOB|nr:cytochrome ubiquinol oxidase subunit I [Rubellimicrobium mesophilum]EYD72935.1 putative Cytochrome bd2, subunit I [Rubellimicrobium mesophilum DSM 19309]
MDPDALLLARIQFGFTIAFHIIFPSFTIGLASWLVVLEAQWLRTRNLLYRKLFQFWAKVFAVSFGLGVVSGIVMSYQFGTNWSGYAEFTGNVLGPLIAYEVITSFFLEAAFLGIMLFGWEKVGNRLHFLATIMVALGTLGSSFWITTANSWMQTPAGYAIENGVAVPVDWWRIVFSPSFPNRYMHLITGMYLTTAFAIAGMSAYMLLRARRQGDAPERIEGARRSLSMALWFAAIFAPIQIGLGDLQGLAVLDQQPTKLAAIEANWETQRGVPLILFAWPDQEAQENRFEIAIPRLGSVILAHDPNGEIPGLRDVPRDRQPPVLPVFFSFRIMVGLGFLMLGVGVWSLWLRWRGRLFDRPAFLWTCFAMTPAGVAAVVFGWFTAEIGRQPWLVYGLLHRDDAVSPTVEAPTILASLVAFVVVYAVIFGFGTYYLFKLLRRGPDPHEEIEGENVARKPKRPLSTLGEGLEGPLPRGASPPAE